MKGLAQGLSVAEQVTTVAINVKVDIVFKPKPYISSIDIASPSRTIYVDATVSLIRSLHTKDSLELLHCL